MQYITTVERTMSAYHRSKFIIHNDTYYIAEFDTRAQLDMYLRNLGITTTVESERNDTRFGHFIRYKMDKTIKFSYVNHAFEIPADAKAMRMLCSGSIVTCYYVTTDSQVMVYRPNPNSPELFDPLPTDLHGAHKRIYGSY